MQQIIKYPLIWDNEDEAPAYIDVNEICRVIAMDNTIVIITQEHESPEYKQQGYQIKFYAGVFSVYWSANMAIDYPDYQYEGEISLEMLKQLCIDYDINMISANVFLKFKI